MKNAFFYHFKIVNTKIIWYWQTMLCLYKPKKSKLQVWYKSYGDVMWDLSNRGILQEAKWWQVRSVIQRVTPISYLGTIQIIYKDRQGRPRWYQTLHWLASQFSTTKIYTFDAWHMKGDMWHMTRDMWHVTSDMWHLVGVNILSKFSSLALTVWGRQCFEDISTKDDWVNQSVNELRRCL